MKNRRRKASQQVSKKTFLGVVSRRISNKVFQITSLDLATREEFDAVGQASRAQVGDVVRARVTQRGRSRDQCVIEQVVNADSPLRLANQVSLELFEVPREWPSSCQSDVPETTISGKERSRREDLREIALVTIDGQDAKDFDDAVYCAEMETGWRLVVAIADVAHYVKPGQTLDQEAQRRGCSVYLPETVIPMLPESLSNGTCSLKPYEDRLAVVCDMQIDRNGDVIRSTFSEAVIRSHGRLTYGEVAGFLDGRGLSGRAAPLRQSLEAFHRCYQCMSLRSQSRGALDFDTGETAVTFRNGMPIGINPVQRNDAHQMIELAMIAANVQAALFLERSGREPMYRLHEAPKEIDLGLISVLRERGVEFTAPIKTPQDLQKILQQIREKIDRPQIWELALLASMEQAYYGPSRIGHFGLALETYLHFTSPIRRYPDLMVHRQIKACLTKRSSSETKEPDMKQLGEKLSFCERRAISAERRVDGWMKCLLVQSLPQKTLQGTVSSVQAFGMFIELDHYAVSGLVHISNLGNEYFDFFGSRLVGSRTGTTYSVGDRVTVRCVKTSPPLGRLDLKMA